MIPKIIAFKGTSIESAISNYENELPAIVDQFEKEYGECQVSPSIVYNYHTGDFIITVMLTVNEAKNKITESGLGLIDSLKNRMNQVFNAEGCQHEYEQGIDGLGNENIICKKCGTPLA